MKKLLTSALFCLPLFAQAAWVSDDASSSIHFLSTKKEHIIETHQFDRFTASLSDSGAVKLEIDLTSANTLIPIRNERLQEFLFETSQFAKATLNAQLDADLLTTIQSGKFVSKTVNANLNLHGVIRPIKTKVNFVSLKNGDILVQSQEPIIIDSRHYELATGVDKLKSLAGLPSIGYTVPVVFSLVMKSQ